jgi:GntR family transcriptional regulator
VQGLGTFVAEEKVRQEAGRLTSFTQDMRERGMEVSSEVLEVGTDQAGPVVARMLGIQPGEKIVRVKRVRHADGKPMALETSHLLYERARGIVGLDLTGLSLYEELGKSGVRIAEADQSYEAVLVNEAENKHLGVPVGSPALLIERITYDADGRPFEYVKSVYRGDRYRVAARLRAP